MHQAMATTKTGRSNILHSWPHDVQIRRSHSHLWSLSHTTYRTAAAGVGAPLHTVVDEQDHTGYSLLIAAESHHPIAAFRLIHTAIVARLTGEPHCPVSDDVAGSLLKSQG